jgi:hypothetical protein
MAVRTIGLRLVRGALWLLVGAALLTASLLIPGVRVVPAIVIFAVAWATWGGDELPTTEGLITAWVLCSAVLGVAPWGVRTALTRRTT